jgi:hypothetical protein
MRQNPTDDELLRSYLLDEISEPETDALERRLLADDELFDLLESLEAELLAAAGRGELSAAETKRVLRRLASSPRGQERLALARSLNTMADRSAAAPASRRVLPFLRRALPSKAVWGSLAAAAALLLVVCLQFAQQRFIEEAPVPLVSEYSASQRPAPSTAPKKSTSSVAEKKNPQSEVAQKEDPQAPLERRQPAVLVLSLATLRGGAEEVDELRIPADTERVEIQLDIEGMEDLGPFHAAVRSEGNTAIWEKGNLEPRKLEWGSALVLEIPADRLPEGDYKVTVTGGTEEVGTEDFKVVRETR